MSKRLSVRVLAVFTLFVLTSGASPIATAQAQNDIPFAYDVIDPNPPLQSHCKAVGDIDGDGFPDVLVGSANNGYGFFWYRYPNWEKYTIVPPGTGFTTDMQVGDVDGDGDLDAIIPKGFNKGKTVWWYENPRPGGNPATDTWVEHNIGTAGAHDVEVGDINNDGKLDVVARDNSTTVFIQNTPTSWTKNVVNTRSIEGTALGDIDSDGDLDIAINGYWLENPMPGGNPGTDSWTEYTITTGWPQYSGVLIVDINEDGRADVALSPSETTGRFSWYEAPVDPKGGGWIERPIDASVEYVHTFEAADMDLDGDLDFITAEMLQSNDPDEVVVYRNNGGGASWTKQVVATTGSHNIRVADIGSDGDLDIVGINWQGTTPLEMWHNELNPAPASLDDWDRHVIDANKPARAVFIKAGDLSGDGLPDIVTGGWWYQNPGAPSGSWTRSNLGAPLNNMAAVHDFDKDGRLDVLGTEGVGSANNPNFVWARNNGSGSFTIYDNINAGAGDFLQGVSVQPFSGGSDEVALSWHAGSNSVQRLTVPADPVNQTWVMSELASTSQKEDLSAGDIDRDGDLDLLLGTVWLRNDGATWSAHTLNGTSSTPDRNRLADINGDGRLDAVVGFEFESKLTWYEQPATATGTWPERTISSTFNSPMSLDVGDLDGDGDTDVVVGEHDLSNPTTALLHVFENENSGSNWTSHSVHTGDEHHDGTQLVDIDLDGDLDIISIGWTHGRVLVYENKSTGGGGPSNQAPVASFTATPNNGAAPLPVNFDASASFDPDGDLLTYGWTFGDGGTATGSSPAHTYTADGNYTVTLTVNDGSLSASTTRSVSVSSQPPSNDPIAHWPLDETSGTTAADIAGSNPGTLAGGPVWQPSGGRVGGALEFDGSDDRVQLGGLDIAGGSGMTIALWARVDAFNIIDARLISKATGVQSNDHFWMLSMIDNSALRFRLKLGTATTTLATTTGRVVLGAWMHVAATYDGSTMRLYKDGVEVASVAASGAIATDPSALAELGNQPAGAARALDGALDDVRIYNRALSTSEIGDLANPGGNQPPTASFTASPLSGEAPITVDCDASASSDPDGDPLTYSWDFGDGGSATGVAPSHTYSQAGNYTVELTVSDGTVTDSATRTINVVDPPPPNRAPLASFTTNPDAGTPPLPVAFDASGSSDPDGDALTYQWDFGDGGTGSGVSAAHTFNSLGTYTVTLTVSDGDLSDTATKTVAVTSNPPTNRSPIAQFTALPSVGQAPLAVAFDASGSSDPDGDPLSYDWDLGEPGGATGMTASHTYTQAGNYTVILTVSDGELQSTATKTVIVQEESIPLELTLGVLQNPYLSEYLDVFVVASEPLNASTVNVTADGDAVAMTLTDPAANVWRGDYEFQGGGILDIQACANSIRGSASCSSISLAAALLTASRGGTVTSPDESFAVRVPDGAVREDTYVIVAAMDAVDVLQLIGKQPVRASASTDGNRVAAYSVGPAGVAIATGVSVEFRLDQFELPPGVSHDQLFIERVGAGALDSYIDELASVVRANSGELGEFELRVGTAGTSVFADRAFARLHQNFPNPFNPSTTIPFEVQAAQNVTISVYDVSGKLVATLLDAPVSPGTGQVTWDGRTSSGQAVGSGIYFVRLSTPTRAVSRKLMLIR